LTYRSSPTMRGWRTPPPFISIRFFRYGSVRFIPLPVFFNRQNRILVSRQIDDGMSTGRRIIRRIIFRIRFSVFAAMAAAAAHPGTMPCVPIGPPPAIPMFLTVRLASMSPVDAATTHSPFSGKQEVDEKNPQGQSDPIAHCRASLMTIASLEVCASVSKYF
jgi:hypothetical protein